MSFHPDGRRPNPRLGIALLLPLLLALPLQKTYGYTDPGTGAMMWQLLSCGILGVVFSFRKVLNFLTQRKKKGQ